MIITPAQCVKGGEGGGVRKMFFSEKTKGLFWSIGSSYWMFNLEVHVSVMGNKIMAKKQPFLAIFGNVWPKTGLAALFWLNTGWTGLNIVSHIWRDQFNPFWTHQKWSLGSQGAPKIGHFWPYLAIFSYRQPNCPIWVEHQLNRVEHFISHMEGPVRPFWTYRKWSQGSPKNGHFWP